MEYIMRDQRKPNERYRRRQAFEKTYMWIASVAVLSVTLHGIFH